MKKAIVIGSGIGGLAIAVRLAVKGYSVEVFEVNSYPGGKLSSFQEKNYRFDAGPSLFTLPELVDDIFKISGKDPKEYFDYEELDTICNYFFSDGTRVKAYSDIDSLSKEIEGKLNVSGKVIKKHLKKSKFIYDSTQKLFLNKSLHKLSSYLSWNTIVSFLKLPFLHVFSSMHSVNAKSLKNKKLIQLFNRYATYNGSNPYKAPGILNIIPHLEYNKGAYFPNGGMIAITNSIYKLACDLGVQFHFSSYVEEVIVEDNKAKGVKVNGKSIYGDKIVSNMDVVPFYKNLINDPKSYESLMSQERSSSALIFYWGVKKSFPELSLHNIFFSDNYKKEFEDIFEKNTIHNDPTIYINVTAKHKKDDAPKGCENWFVMINVPSNKGQDWNTLIKEARKNILDKLSKELSVELKDLIEVELQLDPILIEDKTQSYQGALYGTSSNSRMSAFFRHSNFSRDIKNLYFCGGSVHPGGGIPLALSSAKIVDQLIKPV